MCVACKDQRVPGHLLTFELSEEGDELTIYGDPPGLRLLCERLTDLAVKAETLSKPGVEQLSTSAWGGNELSLQPQGTNTRLIYHVRVVAKPRTGKKAP
jgi:hypothetical protein